MRKPTLAAALGALAFLCHAVFFAAVFLLMDGAHAAEAADGAAPRVPASSDRWVSAWGSAQMPAEGGNVLPEAQWRNTSLRQIVRLSLPARSLRVRISNVFGTTPLILQAAAVGLARQPGSPELQRGSARALRFLGEPGVTIPAGAEYLSDPVELTLPAGSDLAVSLHFLGEPVRQTVHPGSRSTSFIVAGNQVMAERWDQPQTVERWLQLSDVEVLASRSVGTLVAVGDSITDGHGVKPDTNTRWTDALSRRLQRAGSPVLGIVNAGIGGGRLLRDGLGPNVMARFERDVLGRAGVTHALLLIGVNDLGNQHRNADDGPEARARLLTDMRGALSNLVERAHAQGICVIGATITPYMGSDYYRPTAANESDRQALNDWIRRSGRFDAVADFDTATRDPARPDTLAAWADLGDRLHLSADGNKALAEAVPIEALRSCAWGRP